MPPSTADIQEAKQKEQHANDTETAATQHEATRSPTSVREYAQAGLEWEEVAARYAEWAAAAAANREYFCAAARAYLKAAEDFQKASALETRLHETGEAQVFLNAADGAYDKAAKYFLKCAAVQIEAGAISDGRASLAKANVIYLILQGHAAAKRVHALKAGDQVKAAAAKKQAEDAKKGSNTVQKADGLIEKELKGSNAK